MSWLDRALGCVDAALAEGDGRTGRRGLWLWIGILGFRLGNALFVRTVFNPDEYWQSTEVAHHLVFGYGHLTWEWQPAARLRGYAHPGIFAVLYKLLAVLGLDSRWAIAYGPRLLQGCFAAMGDYFIYRLARVYFDRPTARWTLLCHLLSWFVFYVLVRPYSNSLEAVCTTAALANWPWEFLDAGKKDDDADTSVDLNNRRWKALAWAALGVLIRPTNALLWIFLGVAHFARSRDRWQLLLTMVLPIAAVTLGAMLIIDRIGYGEWTLVLVNFFKFNVLEGKDRLYGVHPWSWYFVQGFPAITGTFLPLILAGWMSAPDKKRELGRLVFWVLLVFSSSAHKEFRFVFPVLPAALVYAGYCLRNLEKGLYTQIRLESQHRMLRAAAWIIIIPNISAAIFLSRWHQRAPIDVMDFVSSIVHRSPSTSVHFWTPCHATPYFSFLHQNVSMWFPDCSPDNRLLPEGCESHRLERDPIQFLSSKYRLPESHKSSGSEQLPEIVVLFSSTEREVASLLAATAYAKVSTFFHNQVAGDDVEASAEMIVYQLKH